MATCQQLAGEEMGLRSPTSVLLVDAAAVPHYLPNLLSACCHGLFVGGESILGAWTSGFPFLLVMCGGALGVEVVGQDGEDLAWVFCGELVPELVDILLGMLLLHLATGRQVGRRRRRRRGSISVSCGD